MSFALKVCKFFDFMKYLDHKCNVWSTSPPTIVVSPNAGILQRGPSRDISKRASAPSNDAPSRSQTFPSSSAKDTTGSKSSTHLRKSIKQVLSSTCPPQSIPRNYLSRSPNRRVNRKDVGYTVESEGALAGQVRPGQGWQLGVTEQALNSGSKTPEVVKWKAAGEEGEGVSMEMWQQTVCTDGSTQTPFQCKPSIPWPNS